MHQDLFNQFSLSECLGFVNIFVITKRRSNEYCMWQFTHVFVYSWDKLLDKELFGQRSCVSVILVSTAKAPSKRDCTVSTPAGRTRRQPFLCRPASQAWLLSSTHFHEYLETQTSFWGSCRGSVFLHFKQYLSMLCLESKVIFIYKMEYIKYIRQQDGFRMAMEMANKLNISQHW